MLQMILVACQLANPSACKETTLSGPEGVTTFQCMVGAQSEIAKWANEHPGWKVTGWKCTRPGIFAKA